MLIQPTVDHPWDLEPALAHRLPFHPEIGWRCVWAAVGTHLRCGWSPAQSVRQPRVFRSGGPSAASIDDAETAVLPVLIFSPLYISLRASWCLRRQSLPHAVYILSGASFPRCHRVMSSSEAILDGAAHYKMGAGVSVAHRDNTMVRARI